MVRSVIKKFSRKVPGVYYLGWSAKRKIQEAHEKSKRIERIFCEFDKDYSEHQPAPSKLEKPNGTLIEITNACNLNCVMCNTKLSKRSIGFISPEIFEKVLRQLSTIGLNVIGLHTVGETFMYKNLDTLLEVARKYGFTVWISTNGQFPKAIEPIFKRFPDIISSFRLSIDGASKSTYESIRRGGKFEKVFETLGAIDRINQGKRSFRVPVLIASILSTTNINDIPLFFKKFAKYCFPEQINFSLVNGLSPDPSYFQEAFPFPNLISPVVPCHMPFQKVYFTFQGKVTLCCRDYNEELVVGDISMESLIDIWDGRAAEDVREQHLYPDKLKINMCKHCYSPYPSISMLMNEYIHALYSSAPDKSGEQFGKEIIDLLNKLDQCVGDKKFTQLRGTIRSIFSELKE